MRILTKEILSFSIIMACLLPLSLTADSETGKIRNYDLQISQVDEKAKAKGKIEDIEIMKQPRIHLSHGHYCDYPHLDLSQNMQIANYSVLLDFYQLGQSKEQLGFSLLYPDATIIKKEILEKKASELEETKEESSRTRNP